MQGRKPDRRGAWLETQPCRGGKVDQTLLGVGVLAVQNRDVSDLVREYGTRSVGQQNRRLLPRLPAEHKLHLDELVVIQCGVHSGDDGLGDAPFSYVYHGLENVGEASEGFSFFSGHRLLPALLGRRSMRIRLWDDFLYNDPSGRTTTPTNGRIGSFRSQYVIAAIHSDLVGSGCVPLRL